MKTELKIETYRASNGRNFKIEQNGTITVKKILREEEWGSLTDVEPQVGHQPHPKDEVRFTVPVPKDLIFRANFLARRNRKQDKAFAL